MMWHVGRNESGVYIRLGAAGTPHVVFTKEQAREVADKIMEIVDGD